MKRHWILWFAVLTGPITWLAAFAAVFFLSGWTCPWRSKLPLYLISSAALIITSLGATLAYSQWRSVGKDWPGEAGGEIARARAMAIAGLALNLMFFLVVVAQAIPQILLVGCE